MTDTNLARFRAAVAGALAHLESRRREVNDLNVFPVADGDTGDNMALTLRAVLDELDRLQTDDGARTIDEIGREEIVQSVARAMAKVCHSCGKGPAFGHSRSHSMVATKRRFDPNLQKVRILVRGAPRRVYVCTRCLKAGKVTKAA